MGREGGRGKEAVREGEGEGDKERGGGKARAATRPLGNSLQHGEWGERQRRRKGRRKGKGRGSETRREGV